MIDHYEIIRLQDRDYRLVPVWSDGYRSPANGCFGFGTWDEAQAANVECMAYKQTQKRKGTV